MRYAMALAGCLMVSASAGCGSWSPRELFAEFPRVAMGTPAKIAGTRFAEVFHQTERPFQPFEWEFNDILVKEGDRLTVLEDKGDVADRRRHVLVQMESGTKKGNVYRIERESFTPD